ncbi:MAG: ABC-2 type transport system ATP-binding protein [bacterium]|nr:MAG: ABC-2 type transport system ATP-binding protein [bacterium]
MQEPTSTTPLIMPRATRAVVIVDNLSVKYNDFTAVSGVSFVVERGEIFGLLGPNGSGKTTLIKTLCGLVKPTSGKGSVLDLDIRKDAFAIKGRIGYMSQKFSLYEDLSVKQNIDFYGTLYGLTGKYLKQCKEEVIDLTMLEKFLDRRAGQLSGGWKQRLALACAIIHRPEVVFLDEPTAGIDPVARRYLWDLLFQLSGKGTTFFVTTHYMDEAERCGRIAYIYFSKMIAFGTPSELKALPEVSPADTARLEITCSSPAVALAMLKNFPYVIEATIFGQSIHALVKAIVPIDKLRLDLANVGFKKTIIVYITPSLEDVFVTLTNYVNETKEKRPIVTAQLS